MFLEECSLDDDQGATKWNSWRSIENIKRIDLSKQDLSGLTLLRYNLAGIDFSDSDLRETVLIESILLQSDFSRCILHDANLSLTQGGEAIFRQANMSRVNLNFSIHPNSDFRNAIISDSSCTSSLLNNCDFTECDLNNSNLICCNLTGSNFYRAQIQNAHLVGANLTNSNLELANISGSNIFGISAWNIISNGLIQKDLRITNDKDEFILTVDDVEVGQFIYLMSTNSNLKRIIDTITSKVVLILGRFTKDMKPILDSLKIKLREHGYISVVFDFEGPTSRSLTETIGLLGRMSKFIIADITDAKSIPQELSELIPNNPSLVIKPILLSGKGEYSMFEHWKPYPWVLPVLEYESEHELLSKVNSDIILKVQEYLDSKL